MEHTFECYERDGSTVGLDIITDSSKGRDLAFANNPSLKIVVALSFLIDI